MKNIEWKCDICAGVLWDENEERKCGAAMMGLTHKGLRVWFWRRKPSEQTPQDICSRCMFVIRLMSGNAEISIALRSFIEKATSGSSNYQDHLLTEFAKFNKNIE